MGIKPELVERIFEPYVRDPDTEVSGTGIGLSFVRKIIDWHGGEVRAESELGLRRDILVYHPRLLGSPA